MAFLLGEGKPMADMGVLHSIETAPKDQSIMGAWVSKTGKLLHEQQCWWFAAVVSDDDDCPVNIESWAGWSVGLAGFVFPSHWQELTAVTQTDPKA